MADKLANSRLRSHGLSARSLSYNSTDTSDKLNYSDWPVLHLIVLLKELILHDTLAALVKASRIESLESNSRLLNPDF